MLKYISENAFKLPFCSYTYYTPRCKISAICERFTSSFVHENNIEPVKLAYSSYESTDVHIDDYPVVIMHGLLGSKNNWNSLSKAIHNNTKRKIIAIDARNHGDSPHTSEFTYEHMMEDARWLLSDLNIKKTTAIGHSMGGRAMMLLALKHPHLIESLVVVDISPVRISSDISTLMKLFEAMLSVHLEGDLSLSTMRKAVNQQLMKLVTDSYMRQFLLTNLVDAGGGHYKWRVNLDSIMANFPEICRFPETAGRYEGPTLFIGGEKSNFLCPEDHSEILEYFPKAQFKYIEGAGHWLHSEKSNEFLALVCDFINKL